MITQQEANRLRYRPDTVTDADLSAGPDEGVAVPSGTVGEVFNVQVGGENAGTLSDVLAAVVGVPGERFKETTKSKATLDLQDATPADVPSNTYVRIGKRRRSQRGGPDIHTGLLEDDYSDVAKINRPDMTPREPGIRESELLTVQVYNPSADVTVSLADSTVQIPVQTGSDY